MTNPALRVLPQSRGAKRIAIVGIVVLLGYYVLQLATTGIVTTAVDPLYVYHGRVGPYLGHFENDQWIADHLAGTFRPGDVVTWVTMITLQAGVRVTSVYDLSCDGKPQGGIDQIRVGKPDVDGDRRVNGMMLPEALPGGPCQIDPRATFRSANGRRTEGPIAFPPIRFTVQP